MIDFRKQIVAEMKRQGLSAYALAKATGMSPRTVQIFVAGTQDTTTERLAKFCEVLGLTLTPKRRGKAARKRGAG